MQEQSRVLLDFPFPEERVFRYQAMQDILHQLTNHPHEAFTQKELADLTGADVSTVSRSVNLLEQMGVIIVNDERPARVRIDPDHLQKPDPILAIPQDEFRGPIKSFLKILRERIEEADEVEDIVGVVLFGSVARGTADRGSDIDLLVIVNGTHTYGRRIANRAARNVEEQPFDGDRYEFEVLVETPESASDYGSKLRGILDEGLILERNDDFPAVRSAVYGDETLEGE